jgi:uncharacterized protein YjbI with pentapeptide repeats
LEGANLEKTDLQGANLRGARYDENTLFPKGFTPEQSGLIFTPSAKQAETTSEEANPQELSTDTPTL